MISWVPIIGLMFLVIPAGHADVGIQAGGLIHTAEASADIEDEEDDEEEEATNFRDRVREVQQWMNRRGAERQQTQGLDANPDESPPLSAPYPKYFQDNGYDEYGYRRLNKDFRVRLRDAPHSYSRHGHRRHSSWHRHGRRHGHHYHSRGGSRHYYAHSSRHAGRHAGHSSYRASSSKHHLKSRGTAVSRHSGKARSGHHKSGRNSRLR